MKMEIETGIHNRFTIEVIDAQTGEVRQKAKAENVICSNYWSVIRANNTSISYIEYGSGTGTPSESDTALFHYEGRKNHDNKNIRFDGEIGCAIRELSINLGVSEANGITLTEVGLSANQNQICTHAILRDMNGNPISIEKTDTDIINIYATVFLHVDELISEFVYLNDSFADGNQFGLAKWLLGINVYRKWFPSVELGFPCTHILPSRTIPNNGYYRSDSTVDISASFNAATKILTLSGRIGVGAGNIEGGIKYLVFMDGIWDARTDASTNMKKQFVIPVGAGLGIEGHDISADSIGTGDGSKTAFQTHFDVARDFVLKVNGTAVSDYTRDGRNITFSAAPEIGAVVTADYFTDTIPKDADHVYDLTVTISFGEYTPE